MAFPNPTQEALQRANRALRTINACNRALVREKVEQSLLDRVCRTVVDPGGYQLAWVGYAEHNSTKTVRPVAQAGYEAGYLERARITWGDSDTGRGPTGSAIRTGKPCCALNLHTQPEFTPWRNEAIRRGYASSIALPLQQGGEVFGALTIYAREPDAFDEEEKQLLQSLAENLAYGIAALRTEQERQKAENKLRESEAKYRMIFDCSPLGIFHFDPHGTVTATNDNVARIFGTSKEELLGFNILNSTVHEEIHSTIRGCLAGQRTHWEGYYYSRYVSRTIPLKADYAPILDRNGCILGGIGILEDISARKQAEEALRDSEKQLRSLSARLLTAQEEERKRIAAELHDSIGSSLSGIKFSLQSFRNRCPVPLSAPLENLVGITQRATDDLRSVMNALRPSMLDDLGLNTTIGWFCRESRTLYPDICICSEIHIDEARLPDSLKTPIFRIIQEAFNNIAKYAQAEKVDLSLRESEEEIVLLIADDGIGFDPKAAHAVKNRHKGIGLSSMRERAELSGGTFSILSASGQGTSIRAAWPLRTPQQSSGDIA